MIKQALTTCLRNALGATVKRSAGRAGAQRVTRTRPALRLTVAPERRCTLLTHVLRGWMSVALLSLVCSAGAFAADAETPTQVIDRAYALLSQRKADVVRSLLEDAVKRLKGALLTNPDDVQANYDMARALWLLGQRGGAVESITKATQLEPDNVTYRLKRFEYLRAVGRVDDTIIDLKQLIARTPNDAASWYELGRSYVIAKNYEEAHKAYDRAGELDPKLPHLYQSIGMLYAREQNHKKAAEAFTRQVELTPDDYSANYNLGQIFSLHEDYAKALEHFIVAHKADPNDAATLAKIVQCYQMLGKIDEREAARRKIANLYNEGKLGSTHYCRDQFVHAGHRIIAMEYFKLEGEKPKRYEFIIFNASGSALQYRVILGSSDLTTALSRRSGLINSEQRIYHLDGETSREHHSYKLYKSEPTYDEVREIVLGILDGNVKPTSTLRLGE